MEKNIYNNMVKRSVLYSLGMWILVFIWAAIWTYCSYASFGEVSTLKEEVKTLLEEEGALKKSGIAYGDFKWQSKKHIKNDKNLQKIVDSMEKNFYQENFINNDTNISFAEFLKEKEKLIDEEMSSEKHKNMRKVLSTVLPSYSWHWLEFEETNTFSELKLINYIERIMQTFNLEYTGEIGVSQVVPLVEESQALRSSNAADGKMEESRLENKIFYIPLSFQIVGNKSSIIDFLYYIENVGKIDATHDSLTVYKDKFFDISDDNYRSNHKVIEWEKWDEDYNIYMNQMIEIESVIFEEYIYKKRDGDRRGEFLNNIRKFPQGQEEFAVDIALNFYVKGVSDYEIEAKYAQIVENIVAYEEDIQKSQLALSSLKWDEKHPDIGILLKRLVSYEKKINQLKSNLENYKKLSIEQVYDDILTSLETERLLKADLIEVSEKAKIEIDSLNEDEEEDLEEEEQN